MLSAGSEASGGPEARAAWGERPEPTAEMRAPMKFFRREVEPVGSETPPGLIFFPSSPKQRVDWEGARRAPDWKQAEDLRPEPGVQAEIFFRRRAGRAPTGEAARWPASELLRPRAGEQRGLEARAPPAFFHCRETAEAKAERKELRLPTSHAA